MTEKQEPKPYQHQVYDSTLKSLLQDQPGELLSLFIDNVEVLQSLDGEAIKPTTLRTDRCFLIKKTSKRKVLHLELETGADSDILPRMLELLRYSVSQVQVTDHRGGHLPIFYNFARITTVHYGRRRENPHLQCTCHWLVELQGKDVS